MIINYSFPLNPPRKFETEANSITLGRNPSSGQTVDIELGEDDYVSRVHARITCENDEYWVEDMGSVNGTWVNGREINTKTRLFPGDKVKMGLTIVEVEIGTVPPSPESEFRPDIPTAVDEPVEPGPAPDAPTFVNELGEAVASVFESAPEMDSPIIVEKQVEIVEEPIESAAPPLEPAPIPESEGIIIDIDDLTSRPYMMPGKESADEVMTQTLHQLTAFNNLSKMLETADSLDSLVKILVEQLQKAIPSAQRGAVLLPDERGELLLKAHWPPGDHSVSMTWIKRAYNRREHFIWAAPEGSRIDSDTPHSVIFYRVQSAIYVPLLLGKKVLGVMYVDNFITHKAFSGTDLELMRAIANQVSMFIRDHVLRKDMHREEKIISNLSRQFSPKIAKSIFGKGGGLHVGGERVDPVTILVSDVRGFTALSAKMEPDDVVRMLNEMFDAFVPIIFEYDGVVDKYVGDSVLAIFGSPEKDDDQCEKAVRVALEMQQAVQKLGEGRRVRRLPVFNVGISVHTGEAIHGFIGSTERMEYTVVGDTVNQASRYCDGAGPGEIVISKSVYERVYHLLEVQAKMIRTKHPEIEPDLEAYVVKGMKESV